MEHLFVYGTLIPGQINDFVLKKLSGTWQKASVKGFFDKKGWLKTQGFPAVIIDENGNTIYRYLFSTEELSKNWQMIDDFESDLYQRVKTSVFLENNHQVIAYIYELNKLLSHDIQPKKR